MVNADAELDAIVARHSGISLIHLALPLSRTTQCIDDTGELDQQTVPRGFDDTPAMFADLRMDYVSAVRS